MDNYFQRCPPMMSDGRLLTDWKTATQRNEYIKYINNIIRDDEYRMLLQNNAATFMNNEWNYLKKKLQCKENQCVHNYPTRTLPQLFSQELNTYNYVMDKTKPPLQDMCQKFNDFRMTADDIDRKCTSTSSKSESQKNNNANDANQNKSDELGYDDVQLFANPNDDFFLHPN